MLCHLFVFKKIRERNKEKKQNIEISKLNNVSAKGRTIRYPGGVRKFKKKKSPSKRERKKKIHPRSGQEKKKSPSKWQKINTGGV